MYMESNVSVYAYFTLLILEPWTLPTLLCLYLVAYTTSEK